MGGEISIAAEAKQVKWHLKAVSLLTERTGKATFDNKAFQLFYQTSLEAKNGCKLNFPLKTVKGVSGG